MKPDPGRISSEGCPSSPELLSTVLHQWTIALSKHRRGTALHPGRQHQL